MAHAIFNVSPVKFLSSIQDHVFTVTPTFKNKTFTKSDNKKKHQSSPQQQEEQLRNSSASPVTLQLTLPTDSIDNQMTEIQHTHTPSYESSSLLQQQQRSLSPSVLPIDIPSRSYPLNVPVNSHHSYRGDNMNNEGLAMSNNNNNNFLSTSYNSHHSYGYQQENNFVSLANSLSKSPYLPAEDLTLCFDGLAVRSPTGSFYSNGGIHSPQNINSPVNIGSPQDHYNGFTSPHGFGSPHNGLVSPHNGLVSPHNGFVSPQNGFVSPQNGFVSPHNGFASPQNGFANYGASPHSPVYFDGGCSPQSTSFNNNNNNFLVGSPSYNNNNSFVGSPPFNNNQNSFVGSPLFDNNQNSFVGSPSFNANNQNSFVGSPSFNANNQNSFVGSPPFNNNNSFVGSPNSPSCFLGSPALSPVYNTNELGIDTSTYNTPQQQQQDELSSSYGFNYLSSSLTPQHQNQTSPINSPSPTVNNNNNTLYLIPPSTTGNYSRPSSPVPDDVILTASEVNDYINSPYSSTPSPSVVVPPLDENMYRNNNDHSNQQVSEFLFGQQQQENSNTTSPLTAVGDMELFPTQQYVSPSSPHITQPQHENPLAFSKSDDIEEDEDEEDEEEEEYGHTTSTKKKVLHTTTPSGRRAKIHKCPYCNHTSNRANNMREHTQIHNPNRPKPHACKLCNRAFARKHDMNRHYVSCKKQHSKSSNGGAARYAMSTPLLS